MCNLLSWIAITMALALAANGAASARTLLEQCHDLQDKMSNDKALYEDPMEALAFVTSELRSKFTSTRYRLAEAFEAAVLDEGCISASVEYLALIAHCQPRGPMESLNKAAVDYGKKCLTHEAIEQRIARAVDASSADSLNRFLGAQFSADYHADNPNEIPLHFVSLAGDDCCQASRAGAAMAKALTAQLERQGDNAVDFFKGNPDKLAVYLNMHLFEPCRSYVGATKALMWDLYKASDYYPNSDQFKMIADLSQEAQGAIFRHKLCANIEYLREEKTLLAALESHLV